MKKKKNCGESERQTQITHTHTHTHTHKNKKTKQKTKQKATKNFDNFFPGEFEPVHVWNNITNILADFEIQTNHPIQTKRPSIILINYKKSTCKSSGFHCPSRL